MALRSYPQKQADQKTPCQVPFNKIRQTGPSNRKQVMAFDDEKVAGNAGHIGRLQIGGVGPCSKNPRGPLPLC